MLPGLNDISVFSRSRKKKEFYITQKKSGGYLFIDGKKVCQTKKGYTYLFHILDKKIDHFEKIKPEDMKYWEFDSTSDPEEWCDVCTAALYPEEVG